MMRVTSHYWYSLRTNRGSIDHKKDHNASILPGVVAASLPFMAKLVHQFVSGSCKIKDLTCNFNLRCTWTDTAKIWQLFLCGCCPYIHSNGCMGVDP